MNPTVLDQIIQRAVNDNNNNNSKSASSGSLSIYASLKTLLAQCDHVLLNASENVSNVISILPIQVIIHQPFEQVSHPSVTT